jgi:hypothetical protein
VNACPEDYAALRPARDSVALAFNQGSDKAVRGAGEAQNDRFARERHPATIRAFSGHLDPPPEHFLSDLPEKSAILLT